MASFKATSASVRLATAWMNWVASSWWSRSLAWEIAASFLRYSSSRLEASIWIFGYKDDQPFEKMPKLHVRLGALRHTVQDQDRRLPDSLVRVSHKPKEITVHVPMELLGYPQRVLMSGQTHLGEVPLDWASWRIVEIASPS